MFSHRANLETPPVAEDLLATLATQGHIGSGHRVQPHFRFVEVGKEPEGLTAAAVHAEAAGPA